jgi:hypothetical protein
MCNELEKAIRPFLHKPPSDGARAAIIQAVERLNQKVRKVEFSHGKIVVRMESGVIVVTI